MSETVLLLSIIIIIIIIIITFIYSRETLWG